MSLLVNPFTTKFPSFNTSPGVLISGANLSLYTYSLISNVLKYTTKATKIPNKIKI